MSNDAEEMEVAGEAGGEAEGAEKEKGPEFEPPHTSILKVLKRTLPDHVQVGKDAKATFTRAAGIFILYITACANDFCREAKRTTISPQDIYKALEELEFEEFIEPLKDFMRQYKEGAGKKKESKGAAKAAKDAEGQAGAEQEDEEDAGGQGAGEEASKAGPTEEDEGENEQDQEDEKEELGNSNKLEPEQENAEGEAAPMEEDQPADDEEVENGGAPEGTEAEADAAN